MSNDPTQEASAENIWAEDLLDRARDALLVAAFLTGKIEERTGKGETASYVLNIDARWGQGKSFFLTRLQRQLNRDGHLTAYVNAWEDDHSDDPLIAIIKAIDETFQANSPVAKALHIGWERAGRLSLNSFAAPISGLPSCFLGWGDARSWRNAGRA